MLIDDPNELQIIGAAYGLGKVTSKVISLVNRTTTPQSLRVTASKDVFGDTWPENPNKSLTIVYRYGSNGSPRVASAKQGESITIGPAEHALAGADRRDAPATPLPLTIWGATYGARDVTSIVTSKIAADQSLSIVPNNATFAPDPWYPVKKTFVLVASYPEQTPFIDIVIESNTEYSLKFRPPLKILSGYYGKLDVTSVLQGKVSRRTLSVRASDEVFSDGWRGVKKSLDVVYQYGECAPRLSIVRQDDNLSIDFDGGSSYTPPVDPVALNVIAAAYGTGDVTQNVRSLISGQTLHFTADNRTFSDTWRGTKKSFAMTYSWGPSSSINRLVVEEGSEVAVSKPAVKWDENFTSLVGLLATGDQLTVQTGAGRFWKVQTGTRQLLANGPTLEEAEKFTVGVVSPGRPGLTLRASDNSYVTLGSDGILHTGGTAAEATVLVPSLLGSGSIALCVSGASDSPLLAVNGNDAVAVSSDYSPNFSSSFVLRLSATAVGLENHLRDYTGRSLAESENLEDVNPALLQVIWDLTGGWFLALGLGPLVSGATPRPGLFNLIRANPAANTALNNLITAIQHNPEASLTAAFITFEGVIWSEGLMWPLFRMVVNMTKWWVIASVTASLLVKLAVLPELEAADLVASFGIWAYNTTRDIIAFVNSGAPENLTEARALELVP